MAAQTITDCRNFTLDFKQHGFCASPLFLQTLGPWFPNEIQNVLSSEKRTLDHWATVQFFFSLAQVRCFWRCFCFRSGLVALFPKMSERGDSWFTFTFIHLADTFIQSYLQLRNAISDTLYRHCSEQILARQWGVKGKRAKLRKDALFFSSFSSLLVKLSQVFESALLDSILKLVVISVACAHFPTQFLPSSQLCL